MGKTRRGTCQDGFTLIEVITVILIIGILTAVITTRGSIGGEHNARASELRSQLRYLHLMAMKTGGNMLALVNDGTSYWAYSVTNGTRLPLPGESATTISLSDKNMLMPAFAIAYDGYGIPYSYNASTNSTTKLTASSAINVSVNGQNATLSVAPETGHVQ